MKMPDISSWEDLRVLLTVARAGSFLAAGRELGMSTSTVARRISALERQLQTTLVARAAEGAKVESSATVFLELAERIEVELAAAARDARRPADALSGTVRISVGDGVASFVADAMARFRVRHPETFVQLVIEWRVADLVRREADIAIRLGPTRSESTVTRKIGDLTFGLYGSRDYLQRVRLKRMRSDTFARHDFVGYDSEEGTSWLRENGAARFTMLSSRLEGVLAGVRAGHGLALLPDALVRGDATLERVESDVVPPVVPLHLVYARERRNVPRIRAIVDHLRDDLGQRMTELSAVSARPGKGTERTA